jgi:ATP-dependent helicase/nuclease subunit A
VLKSPLFGLNDEDLFEIGWERKGSLHAALRTKASTHARLADAAARLYRFAAWTQQMPFAFYARVLAADGGRKRFLARLGHEADDALDEFLNLALATSAKLIVQAVAWLRGAEVSATWRSCATRCG